MDTVSVATLSTWGVSALAVAGVILRPGGWPEWIWAVGGAILLLAASLLSPAEALAGVASGTDVYLFLAGMMLLSEVARLEGLFDHIAARAARAARGSPDRLFAMVFGVGTLVTVFLSNDATAVVLTPAVAAVARAAGAANPMPYLLVCAFVANAASFVLPISNPANLVIYGERMPPLGEWLQFFALPSLVAIATTFVVLRLSQRTALTGRLASDVAVPALSRGGRIAAVGIVAGAATLLVVSSLGLELGWPTALVGLATAGLVLVAERRSPVAMARDISWGVLPLVAGLFVIVAALDGTGLNGALAGMVERGVAQAPDAAAAAIAAVLGFGTNLTNNLPLGLVAGDVLQAAETTPRVLAAAVIGIDLGPNLSIPGSLATILWLTTLRREGLDMGALRFLALGILVMPPALLLAVGALLLQPW